MAKKTAFDRQREAKTSAAPGRKKTQVPARTSKSSSAAKKAEPVRMPKFEVKETVGREVKYLIILLVWVLLALSLCLGSVFGVFGAAVHDVSVGVLGISAYLICFGAICAVAARMWKIPVRPQYAKDLCLLILAVAVGAGMHIINGKELKTLADWYQKATWYTGGVVGGFIGSALASFIGQAGSLLLLGGLCIICLVVITEKSAIQTAIRAWSNTRKMTKNVEENVKEKVRQHHEVREEQRKRWVQEQEEEKNQTRQPEIHMSVPEKPFVLEEAPEEEEIPTWMKPKASSKPAGDKKEPKGPIHDGSVDIPLISFDSYIQKKQTKQTDLEPINALQPGSIPITGTSEGIKTAKVEKAVEKIPPVSQEEQEKINFGIQQNLFAEQKDPEEYVFPSIELLNKAETVASGSRDELYKNAQKLEQALLSFGVEATVTQVNQGPAVTRYELIPRQGVKVSRIVNLADDIALNLAAPAIRIEAPIPGKSAVGIEVPNKKAAMVTLREVIESDVFRKFPSKLAFSLGKTIDGEVKVTDIGKMPHLLIAGATGSGKSVCINSLLISIMYKAHPKDVKLILIDPKVVELSVYNGIPHLLLPVVNDPKKAAASLNWAVQEMTMRYKKFADMNVRDIRGYNAAVRERALSGELMETMPQIVIVIDELADLMMVAGKEVEEAICRLAQMARAAGMHLVIATQRPSVDVITGVIKANIPSRLAFAVSSGVDSKTILDTVGAEKLLGRGDMLFCPIGESKAVRIQGAFVSDQEVERVVEAVRQGAKPPDYNQDLAESVESASTGSLFKNEEDKDEYLEDAIRLVVEKQRASISMLQRAFRIGFNRAARLIDAMYERGVVGPDEGSKPRKVLMTKEEYDSQGVNQDELQE